MGCYKCVECGCVMIDPDLYYRLYEKKEGKKTRIKCPHCDKVQTLNDMINKKVLDTPDGELTKSGLKLKRKLMKDDN